MNIPGILIIGHGSRESSYDREFEQFVQGYHKLHPEYEIKTAYVELSKSDVKTALRELSKTHNKILIFPLFLFASNHVKNDISLILSDLKRNLLIINLFPQCL